MGEGIVATIAGGAAPTFVSELKEKWPVVAVTFLMMLFAFGVPTFALPFVADAAVDEFGWTRTQAVAITSAKFFTAALAALAIGRLFDTIDPKYLVAACASLGGIGMLAFFFADSWPFYISIGIILGFNSAGMVVATNVIICRTFERSTGTALGIALAGTSTAGMIVPLVMVPLMAAVGWRETMMIMSVGIWLVALPAWFLLMRSSSPTGERLRSATYSAAKTGMWHHFQAVAVTRHFWYIVVGIFLVSAVDQGFIVNQVLFLNNEKGLELSAVAWGATLLAAIGVLSKIGFGWVYDKLSITGIVVCYALLAVAAGLSFAVTGVASMLVFMAIRGIAHGGLIVDGPVLAKHYYGPQNLGLNIGIFTFCTSAGYTVGPPLLASLADASGSYMGGFALAIAAALLAVGLLMPIKPRYWTRD